MFWRGEVHGRIPFEQNRSGPGRSSKNAKSSVIQVCDGQMLMANLTSADMADSTGAEWGLVALKK